MPKPSRNALKGYTFETYVLSLFLAKMDVDREIVKIEAECIDTKQFDDLYIELLNGSYFRIQVKNYPNISIDDITVTDHIVTIGSSKNEYDKLENNVIIVNSENFTTNTEFFGIPAIVKDNIIIVPLTPVQISDYLDDMFSTEVRELQIIRKSIEFISLAKFTIKQDYLPELVKLSVDLDEKTIILRTLPKEIQNGVHHIVGKPGIGKSHYVNELTQKFSNAIVYRFWINSQDSALYLRLQYDVFMRELGLLTFKTPRKFTEKDLVQELYNQDIAVIIDGLDHVENYNPLEMNKYIEFIDLLNIKGIKTIVLSRPLRNDTSWKNSELLNWSIDESNLYLEYAYDISNFTVQKNIYAKTNGYPIITYFIAEHYQKYGVIDNIIENIQDINNYYESLLSSVDAKSLLCTFATSNSFFTYQELKIFSTSPELFEALSQFMSSRPYLFSIQRNRVALIHDSFNTYLRSVIISYQDKEKDVLNIVKESLLNGEIEYMSRLSYFNFDDEFLSELLIKYTSFDEFENLISNTLDFDSISSFYVQLRLILETKQDFFNIYQYYDFALIYQLTQRTDLVGDDGLVFQILMYINRFANIEERIYSSNIIWNVYLASKCELRQAKMYLNNLHYSSNQYTDLIDHINEEISFFDRLSKEIDYLNVEKKLDNTSISPYEKNDELQEYLINIYINNKISSPYYKDFKNYIDNIDKTSIICRLKLIGFDDFLCRYILSKTKSILHGLGYFENDNVYRNRSLESVIDRCAPNGSFSVIPEVQSYIRLANYEKRSIDIFSVNKAWIMYGERKDYSVFTIDDALITFEKKGFIDELKSPIFLEKLMNQSEKGISHLLSSYLNKKSDDYLCTLISSGFFNEEKKIDIFDLYPTKINCFCEYYISKRMMEIFKYHMHTKSIDYHSLGFVLESKYCDLVLQIISYYGYSIYYFNGDKSIIQKLNDFGIEYTVEETKITNYIPLEHGCLHREDLEYVWENNIEPCEIAKYTGGWYDCLPYPEAFIKYDTSLIKKIYLNVIHNALFARVIDETYIGNWNLLSGNIIKLLDGCKIDVDWEKLFCSFRNFLKLSLIDDSDIIY